MTLTILDKYNRLSKVIQKGKASEADKEAYKLIEMQLESEHLTGKLSNEYTPELLRKINVLNHRIECAQLRNKPRLTKYAQEISIPNNL